MSWQGILGHDDIVQRFRRSLANRRLATTFLFVGPEGIGKCAFALRLAQSMLCSRVDEAELAACGSCPPCKQVLSDSHPDLQLVRKPADRAFIPVETFIGDREHRMQTGLCHFIRLTPSSGKRRIAIIDDADWLNQEGANSLLKTLEEPSPGAIIILIGTSPQRQLPTIRSRSQLIRFRPLSDDQVAKCLLDQGLTESVDQAQTMAARAGGSVSQALALADDAVLEFRRQLWQQLAEPTIDRTATAGLVNDFVDAGGKETAAKRKQLRHALTTAMEFYRSVERQATAAPLSGDRDLADAVQTGQGRATMDAETAASLVERCVDGLAQVNANANLPMLVDTWLSDLAMAKRSGRPLLSVTLP